MNQKSKKRIGNIKTQIDDLGRKKFRLQQDSQPQQQEQHDNRIVNIDQRYQSTLVGRQDSLNIQKYIGRIDKNKKKIKTQVFYCEICSEGFKCDLAYITHLNSPSHNRKLGMNMKVAEVSISAVSEKLQSLLKNKHNSKKDIKINKIIQKYQSKNQSQSQHDRQKQQYDPAIISKKQQQNVINPSTLEQPEQKQDNLEMLMKSYGLPTSFGSKKVKR